MSESNFNFTGQFPQTRLRRMRGSEALRRLSRETVLSLNQLIMPYFVCEGQGIKESIEAMPGQYRFSVDRLISEIDELMHLGIGTILLFGIPSQKDDKATSAWSAEGITQKAVREIKEHYPSLLVITDVCLCAFMDHGHCGIINEKGEVDNDASLTILGQVALSHAEAGADIIAPSDMMDGRIKIIRKTLDKKDFKNVPIMSYAAKYASAFYGPFRDAAHSAPNSNDSTYKSTASESVAFAAPKDRKTYQMDPGNRKEALREMAMDIQEGADILMVKPAMAYLDIIREAVDEFHFPIAAYAVSGEYSMIKAAAEKGMLDEQTAVIESMTSLARAGAGMIITYHAKDIAAWHQQSKIPLFAGLTT